MYIRSDPHAVEVHVRGCLTEEGVDVAEVVVVRVGPVWSWRLDVIASRVTARPSVRQVANSPSSFETGLICSDPLCASGV